MKLSELEAIFDSIVEYLERGYTNAPEAAAEGYEEIPFDSPQAIAWSLSFWRILQGTNKIETTLPQGKLLGGTEDVRQTSRVDNGKLDKRLRFERVMAFRTEV